MASVIELIQLDQIALVISENCKILAIKNGNHFSLSAHGINTKDLISFGKFDVAQLNGLSIKHHLIDSLSSSLCIGCNNVEEVQRGLILDDLSYRILLVEHRSIIHFGSLPISHQASL